MFVVGPTLSLLCNNFIMSDPALVSGVLDAVPCWTIGAFFDNGAGTGAFAVVEAVSFDLAPSEVAPPSLFSL